ncbi:MAG: hypothetical protein JWO38_2993 [Gemmataceae bacterium]|nr:hypothetical protein [Gemmataceae bacterium]
MHTAVVTLVALAALDLIGCGVLLAVVWVVYRRQRRFAAGAGEPVPPPATGQFVFLGVLGLVGLVGLYGLAWLLLNG